MNRRFLPRWHSRSFRCLSLALSGALVLCAHVAWAQSSGESLSLRDCIDLALEGNADIGIAQEAVQESRALRASALGNFGPKVKLDANVLRWDKPTRVSFMDDSGIDLSLLPAPTTPYESITASMLQGFATPIKVRDQVTTSTSVTVAQPVSQLYAIYLGYHLQDAGHQANQIRHRLSRQETVFRVTEAYLRVLQAKRYVEIAEAGVATVEAHLAQARDFAEAGFIGRNDLLKAELALANAQGGLVKARAGESLARQALVFLVGRDIAPDTAFANPPADRIPEFTITLAAAKEQALRQRLELSEIDRRIEQARTGKALAWTQYIPSLTAVFDYTHTTGSKFQDENAWFVGGMLNWDVFSWGSRFYQIKAAGSKVRQAELARQKVRDLLGIEVERNFLEVETARQSISIAEAAVAVADESLRVEASRFEVHAATSTDVLDAQTAQQRAQGELATAFYGYLVAVENLRKSVGEDLLSTESGTRGME